MATVEQLVKQYETDTALQAEDKTTGGIINKTSEALTSNLDGDPSARGKGIVK